MQEMKIFKLKEFKLFRRWLKCLAGLTIVFCPLWLAAGCSHYQSKAAYVAKEIPVRFIYTDPQAKKVCVAGNFNDWSTKSDCMTRSGNTWAVQIRLPAGRYRYLFVVNNKVWRKDPGALVSEEGGFGMENSVLIVE